MKLVFKNPGFEVYFSSISDGNVSPRFGVQAEANRNRLLKSVSAQKTAVMATSAGCNIVELNKTNAPKWSEHKADGLISCLDTNLCLALFPADCIPLIIWSHKHNLLSLFHIARLNAQAGFIPKLLATLQSKYSIGVQDMSFYIGPSIQPQSYFFAVIDSEQLRDKKWRNYIRKSGGNYHIDLVGYTVGMLLEQGAVEKNISLSDIDTGYDDLYFSHSRSVRTGEPEGRNLLLIKPLGDA